MSTANLVEYTVDGIPYGVRTLITEKAGPVSVDPIRLIEQATRGKGFIQELADGRMRVRAKAQHCGVKNRNNRVYPARVWEQHLVSGTPFQARIAGRGAIGHLEHPGDGKSQMPLGAIVVTEASPPDENGEVWITFETMSTPPGRVVEAYIRDRVRFGLSSRGNGSVTNRGGVDEVQEDFEPITWDCVIDESTPGAEVSADEHLRESLKTAWAELNAYVRTLTERAKGDAGQMRLLAESDARMAANSIDCKGGVCACPLTESELPPSGFSRYLLACEDGAHYRAYQGTTGQWEVWRHTHDLAPERLASKIPTLDSCQQVAENHYKIVRSCESIRPQWKKALAKLQETWKDVATLPYSGRVMRITSGHGASALPALRRAGMVASPIAEGAVTVYSSFESDKQAVAHVRRVLGESGVKARVEVVGVIRHGRIAERTNIMGINRQVREAEDTGTASKSQPGEMGGGDTVPDTVHTTPRSISPRYKGEDPEDLNLNLDINEDGGESDDETKEPAYGDGPDLEAHIDMREDGEGDHPEPDADDMGGLIDYDDDDDDQADGCGCDDDDDDDGGDNNEPEGSTPEEGCGMAMEHVEAEIMKLAESPAGRAAAQAMFAKAFARSGKQAASARTGEISRGKHKGEPRAKYYQHFRANYARKNKLSVKAASTPGKEAKRVKGESRAYYLTFTRRLNERGGPVAGAVRIWFDQTDRPTSYEFYNRPGILEAVTDHRMRITHRALAEGAKRLAIQKGEAWIAEDGAAYDPRVIVRMGLSEEDLPGRHGGDTGVVVKGDEYMGKEGPEYSTIDGMNDPGERGEEGDGDKPGDYDKATSAGDGEVVKTGTWPNSGSPISMPSEGRRISHRSGAVSEADTDKEDEKDKEDDKKDDDDKKDESFVAHLREKLAFLEGEVSRYESLCQEQHEAIEALRESAKQAEMERARAEAFERHPELRTVESRLMRCESVEELNSEVTGLVSLVETRRPSVPLAAPVLIERARGNGAHSGATRDGVPVESLMESSSPHSDRLGGGMRLGNGDVASRVAAHRKRRRGE